MEYITKAALLIAYDNGMVNRYSTEREVLNLMLWAAQGKYSAADLAYVDQKLSELTNEDLDILCTGEQGEIDVPDLVEDVLNHMFENS